VGLKLRLHKGVTSTAKSGVLFFIFVQEYNNLDIQKEQVQGMWERFSTAKSNAAAESRFH
jgi:hypothetical protein